MQIKNHSIDWTNIPISRSNTDISSGMASMARSSIKATYKSAALGLTFSRASLTPKAADDAAAADLPYCSFPYAELADGRPFYRVVVTAEGKTLSDINTDEGAALVYCLYLAMGGILSSEPELTFTQCLRRDRYWWQRDLGYEMLDLGFELMRSAKRIEPLVRLTLGQPSRQATPKVP